MCLIGPMNRWRWIRFALALALALALAYLVLGIIACYRIPISCDGCYALSPWWVCNWFWGCPAQP